MNGVHTKLFPNRNSMPTSINIPRVQYNKLNKQIFDFEISVLAQSDTSDCNEQ